MSWLQYYAVLSIGACLGFVVCGVFCGARDTGEHHDDTSGPMAKGHR